MCSRLRSWLVGLAIGAAGVLLGAQSITIPNTFVNGTVADATQVNANFSALSANALNRAAGVFSGDATPDADDTRSLGTNALRFLNIRAHHFTGTGADFTGDGSALTALNATNLATGTVATARLGSGTANAGKVVNGDSVWRDTDFGTCNLHVTLEAGVPYSSTDQNAKTTVYVTPVDDGRCGFYDGSAAWTVLTNAETSFAVPSTTSTLYDIWCRNNSGTIACDTTAWTNDTTRATALTTQNNIKVKTGDTTRRYVGNVRTTTVSGQSEDSLTKRYIWSYYRRARRPLLRQEPTVTWAYTTATVRQAFANTANQVDVVVGVAEVMLDLKLTASANNASGSVNFMVGVGEDSTTTISPNGVGGASAESSSNVYVPLSAFLNIYPAIGRHFYAWLEYSVAAGTTNWFGSNGYSIANQKFGLAGWIEG